MIIRVPVANIWTKPIEEDWVLPSLGAGADLQAWTAGLEFAGRYRLYEHNVLQTQVLLGEEVLVVGQEGDWLEVRVPSQPSGKDGRGYPGWLHRSQAGVWPEAPPAEQFVVTKPSAALYAADGSTVEIVYQTALPLLREDGGEAIVLTPDGPRRLRKDAGERGPAAAAGGARLVELGKQFLGLPYLWGGTSAFGYDCSGFTHTLARAIGLRIPRDADDQAQAGTAVEKEHMQPGDLLFFARENGAIHHVGVYAGAGLMLHAPKTGEVVELLPLAGTYYEGALCAVRRLGGDGQ